MYESQRQMVEEFLRAPCYKLRQYNFVQASTRFGNVGSLAAGSHRSGSMAFEEHPKGKRREYDGPVFYKQTDEIDLEFPSL